MLGWVQLLNKEIPKAPSVLLYEVSLVSQVSILSLIYILIILILHTRSGIELASLIIKLWVYHVCTNNQNRSYCPQTIVESNRVKLPKRKSPQGKRRR